MKKVLYIFILLLCYQGLKAQPYGNEWIDFNWPYFKINVSEDGVYRIPYTSLSNAIPNINSINGNRFILYKDGNPVPLYITASGVLGSNDFIEFYGEKNKGILDRELYKDPSHHLNPHYSLFNDTSVYYLSFNNSTANPRITAVANDLTSLPPKENYFLETARNSYNGLFTFGRPYKVGPIGNQTTLYNSHFDIGEGFAGSDFTSSVNYGINTPNIYTSGPVAKFLGVVVSKSTDKHHIRIEVNGNQVKDTVFTGFNLGRYRNNIALSLLSSTNSVKFEALEPGSDRSAVSFMEIIYPRTFDFTGLSYKEMNIEGNAGNVRNLEVQNFAHLSSQPILYDVENNIRITSNQSIGTNPLNFKLPISANDRKIILIADNNSAYNTVANLEQISFVNYNNSQNQGEYIIISHPSYFDDGGGNNWVEEYRSYRSNEYKSITIDVNELYDQFGYGVKKHPLAIRRFIDYASKEWTSYTPENIFLIGKGREYQSMRVSPSTYEACKIPTYGHPGSDNLMSATLNSDVPQIPIGRLSVTDPIMIRDYYNKVVEYEEQQSGALHNGDPNQTLANKEWMKKVLHFGGGSSASEQNLIQNFLNGYKNIIVDSAFGGDVTSFFKTSTAPIQDIKSEFLKNTIKNGISLLTFFGHSAPGSFDVSFDDPENYENYGRYPVILSNGCFAGFLYNSGQGISERFVLEPEKAAIAFISTTSLSLSGSLNIFSTNFYKNASKKHYLNSIGRLISITINDVESTTSSVFNSMINHEMTLHGDPALKLNGYEIPDYAIEPNTVFFDPPIITAGIDSFDVNVVITNLGKVINDDYVVEVTRITSDGTTFDYRKKAPTAVFKDTVRFTLPTLVGNAGFGINKFHFYVDVDREIEPEISESNNFLPNINFGDEITLNITSDDLIPIWPYEFAIVPEQNVTLKASTADAFAPKQWYVIQIDTTELFNSPLKLSTRIYQDGGIVKWTPPIQLEDSVVYYWRTSRDKNANQGYSWQYSSFIYLENEFPGWNQSHYYQYLKDKFGNVDLPANRVFKFVDDVKEVRVKTGNWSGYGGTLPDDQIRWELNGGLEHRWRMGGCGGTSGFTFAIIDGSTGLPWSVSYLGSNFGEYLNYHCSNKKADPQTGLNYRIAGIHPLGKTWSERILALIDSVPDGDYILIYSHNAPSYQSMDAALVSRITALGSKEIASLNVGVYNGPFVFFTKKNDPSFIPFEATKIGKQSVIDTTFTFSGLWNSGFVETPEIGPASEWGSVHWRSHAFESNSSDIEYLELHGIRSDGESQLLTNIITGDTVINGIDASTYPYLKLRLQTKDNTTRTPTQIDYLRVLFEDIPEGAINPELMYEFNDDTINNGDLLTLKLAFENISDKKMDSVLTKFVLRDKNGNDEILQYRGDELLVNGQIELNYEQRVLGENYIGQNQLIVEANPNNDQLEKYHFNNIATIPFRVLGDIINPLLDVTFDGIHIMDGDIVSAKPTILISLKDENKFLALDTNELIDVFITYPNGEELKMVYDNNTMSFYPADLSNGNNNTARVELKPEFIEDGSYKLRIEDQDISGNRSSDEYSINFEVVTENAVSNLLNYPNPFTSCTRFVFTLTGSEVPDFFRIKIFNAKGKVVREIFKEELGNVHIGRNVTEYCWDGTDTYGDYLANGVYFYRVTTSLNGEMLEKYNGGDGSSLAKTDKYFKRGIGKMVILR